MEATRLRCLEEVAEAARERPAERQTARLWSALGALVQCTPPPAVLHGPGAALRSGHLKGLMVYCRLRLLTAARHVQAET
jgi:hypothetical protein